MKNEQIKYHFFLFSFFLSRFNTIFLLHHLLNPANEYQVLLKLNECRTCFPPFAAAFFSYPSWQEENQMFNYLHTCVAEFSFQLEIFPFHILHIFPLLILSFWFVVFCSLKMHRIAVSSQVCVLNHQLKL